MRWNGTPSMPRGLYRLTSEVPQRGDVVACCLEGETAALALARGYLRPGGCPSGAQPLLKRLAGLPGDFVQVDQEGIHINGVLQPDSRSRQADRQGRELPQQALHSGIIPQGQALTLSNHHSGGFDGRYLGLVPLDSLRTVEPLWTIP
ncbi:putative conjugative transfer signal peptidase TraF [Megalodesulfovibrio gigas DSM 1382 = ATCC 19364]|uniref:signal peptidase I n=1 Tax=Megalodesulfovibrio gigas (strain ATCC 19364 / DSM 1382 / NCIMB 9332 / VKM B-1759) TaxID=1121448 RepID=T2G887_MEGG1|nr:putative conjugative transfer signal peptidase TraF [Megalodesulfovibrio gigas DSM 1382 = ATCC 19364]